MQAASDLTWPAPAKINLMLRITGRRPDGYHLLQTVFQFLDYGDRLSFTLREDGQVCRVGDFPGVSEPEDLILMAAKSLQSATGCGLGVDIGTEKHIPMGGGLGGGSSDAATTLIALNYLWQCGLSRQELAEIGLKLGADVPVFVHGYASWAEGVGEKLTPILPDEPWYLVVKPDCHVSTAEIFLNPELTRDAPQTTIRAFLAGETINDCLPVVQKRYPEVRQALEWLDQFSEARLTGTGACVFSAFANEADALAIKELLPESMHGFVAKGVNRSPLEYFLEKSEFYTCLPKGDQARK